MTRKLMQSLLIIVLIIAASGCGKKDSNVPAPGSLNNLQSVDMNGQKVVLKYQFKKGDKFKYKLTSNTNSQQIVQTDSLVKSLADETMTYIFEAEVLDVDKDGVVEMNMNISSLLFNALVNGKKITFDSKANLSNEDKIKFLQFEIVTNTPYRVRVNPKGEIVEISHLDKMIEKMISIQPEAKKMTPDQKTDLMKNISDSEIRPKTALLFRELPSNQVGKDSTWQISAPPASLATFKIENISKFKLEDFVKVNDSKAAKLKVELSVKWTGDKSVSQNGVNYTFADPKISGGGTILFNVDSGMMIRSETSTSFELGVQMDNKDPKQKSKKTFRKDITANKNIIELI